MFNQRHIAEQYLSHNFDEHCLEDTDTRRRGGFSRAAARHMVTTKLRELNFPQIFDLPPPQVVQTPTCDSSVSSAA